MNFGCLTDTLTDTRCILFPFPCACTAPNPGNTTWSHVHAWCVGYTARQCVDLFTDAAMSPLTDSSCILCPPGLYVYAPSDPPRHLQTETKTKVNNITETSSRTATITASHNAVFGCCMEYLFARCILQTPAHRFIDYSLIMHCVCIQFKGTTALATLAHRPRN